ncbi:hypothetical protein PILCRDRAFT_824143 [Piloderma croceum F 1598]|uniref:G domain-containing protein n=1 Tax=Piloderma croceum (strain F 1598) TaxID=765440 RepID=A0A0C3AXG4_PILCF|nr:hypothetical protein PILCRDRAFT_824143 [Piloderma croceum F 1598]
MGPTGAGKSTFIETATGQDGHTIGHGLRSFTDTIRTVRVTHPMDGKPVVLVDTPGFGDTSKSDTEILAMIAEWLVKVYKGKFNLATIVYLHRISDNRMPGSVLMNLQVFAGMCGQKAMPNVILATTMWDLVEEQVGNGREQQLKKEFWKDMVADGCRTERFENTHDSAWDIVDSLALMNQAPVLLSTEMVDTQLRLSETNAGITLNKELQKLIAEQKEAARKLREHAGDQANEHVVKGLNERKAEIDRKIRQTADQLQQLKIPFSRRFVLFLKGRG